MFQNNLRLTWESITSSHQLETREDISWKGQLCISGLESLQRCKDWPLSGDYHVAHSLQEGGETFPGASCGSAQSEDACHHPTTLGCSRRETMPWSECGQKRSEAQVQRLVMDHQQSKLWTCPASDTRVTPNHHVSTILVF